MTTKKPSALKHPDRMTADEMRKLSDDWEVPNLLTPPCITLENNQVYVWLRFWDSWIKVDSDFARQHNEREAISRSNGGLFGHDR